MTQHTEKGHKSREAGRLIRRQFKRNGYILILILLCCLSLLLRILVRYKMGYIYFGDAETSVPRSDAQTWALHSLNLVAGRGYGDYILEMFKAQTFVPPGHPVFLGFFFTIFGPKPDIAGWCTAIVGSLLPLFGYLLAKEMFSRNVGLICAALVAVHLPFVRLGFTLMSEPTALFFTAVSLWLFARLMRTRQLPDAILTGAVFGFTALVRPSILGFGITLTPWLLMGKDIALRRRVLLVVLVLGSALPFLAGWQLRNWKVHGEPCSAYSSSGVRHAWTGANPKYGPGFYSRSAWRETLWREPYATEIQRIKRMQKETREFVRANRLHFYFGCIWRMRMLFSIAEQDVRKLRWSYGGGSFVQTILLASFAVAGFIRAFRVRTVVGPDDEKQTIPGYVWSYAFIGALILSYVGSGFYGASDRYRWPLDYALFPFAALGMYSLSMIGRIPLSAWCEFRSDSRPDATWLKRLRTGLLLLLAVVICVYLGTLAYSRIKASNSPEYPVDVTQETVHEALRESGLAAELEEQEPRSITPSGLFDHLAENEGRIVELKGHVIVWWGRVMFPQKVEDGRLRKAGIVIEPGPGHFGGIRMPMYPAPGITVDASSLRHDDIVTVIARLGERQKAPILRVHAITKGRFPAPLFAETDPDAR